MRELTRLFNQIEAGVWLAIAAAFLIYCFTAKAERRKLGLICFVAFTVFGISDIIESRTGAWWRPWWLLTLKIPCVLTFIYCYLGYRKLTQPAAAESPRQS